MEPADERCRVAICDDQPGFRQVVSAMLGLEVDLEIVGEAADGQEAIELVGKLRPDVLLLDIAMPVMDGLEALPHIREASPETQIVMLSGVTTDSVRQRALEGGACAYVEKGTDIDVIATHVRAVCEKRV